MLSSTLRVWIFALAGLVALAALLWWRAGVPPVTVSQTVTAPESGTASIGGAFFLTDHRGQRVSEAALLGRYTLIYFGYASCPDVCPAELQNIGAALDLLAQGDAQAAAPLQAFFITIDPARDTVPVLAEYMPNFHPKLTGLTGTAEEISAAAKAYRVYYSKFEETPDAQNYLMDHSNIIYLMGPDGKFLAHFGHGVTPEQMAAKLREAQK